MSTGPRKQNHVDVQVRREPAASPVEAAQKRLERFFGRLAEDQFFGKVVLSFQNGHVCGVKLEQTKKLEEL